MKNKCCEWCDGKWSVNVVDKKIVIAIYTRIINVVSVELSSVIMKIMMHIFVQSATSGWKENVATQNVNFALRDLKNHWRKNENNES